MQTAKLVVYDRDYSLWSLIDVQTQEVIANPENYHPLQAKHFHEDLVQIDQTIAVIKSPLLDKSMPGILVLENNKTYGRTENGKRLLYRCIPDNKHYPEFLVPYEIKFGFSKNILNHYVLFKFKHWDDKHPRGELVETVGKTDDYKAFENYQLHCKQLHTPLSSSFKTQIQAIHEQTVIDEIRNRYPAIIDRTKEYVFTIDNDSTTDFDDAISITPLENNQLRISVYISNVALIADHLKLWHYLQDRISTVYLPEQIVPMLPQKLSDDLCSLKEKSPRLALAIDYIYDTTTSKLLNHEFNNVLINVKKNFRYEHTNLRNNTYYQTLLDFTKRLTRSEAEGNIDSHDVVAYWMVKMNTSCGQYLYKHCTGIFKSTNKTQPLRTAQESEMFLYHFRNNVCSRYVPYSDSELPVHYIMDVECYTHITSPIRRMVDLLNQIAMLKIMDYKLSPESHGFVRKWTNQLDEINKKMKAIRKVQTTCELLHLCLHNTTIYDKTFDAIIFDTTTNGYLVYIESLHMLQQIKTNLADLQIGSTIQCRVFLFNENDSINKKILLQMI